MTINGQAGDDTIIIDDDLLTLPVTVTGGDGIDTIEVRGSAANNFITVDGGPGLDTVKVNTDPGGATGVARVKFETTQDLALLQIEAGGIASVDVNGSTVVDTNTLTISTADADGRLDLNDNEMIVRNTPDLAAITALIKTALENGGAFDWQGIGIGSTQAHVLNQLAGSHLYGLGVLWNDLSQVGGSGPIYTEFSGVSGLVGNEILVKSTYFGDSDLSGDIDATDYALIDNAYVNQSGTVGPMRSSGTRSNAAEDLFGSWKYDLGTAEEMIQRHRKEFGSDYDDALDAVRSGKLGLNWLV